MQVIGTFSHSQIVSYEMKCNFGEFHFFVTPGQVREAEQVDGLPAIQLSGHTPGARVLLGSPAGIPARPSTAPPARHPGPQPPPEPNPLAPLPCISLLGWEREGRVRGNWSWSVRLPVVDLGNPWLSHPFCSTLPSPLPPIHVTGGKIRSRAAGHWAGTTEGCSILKC